jgi:hypothetical protein
VLVLAAGCGGGGSGGGGNAPATTAAGQPTTTASGQGSRPLRHDTSRTSAGIAAGDQVCRLLGAAEVATTIRAVTGRLPRLHAEPNDSFELSICRYSGSGALVRVVLDGAADATRRYFDMETEASQLPRLLNQRVDFRLVWDVGDDRTYGGAGAYWTPSRHQLIAIHADRIARVAVTASGSVDRQRRVVASRLARRVLVRADR